MNYPENSSKVVYEDTGEPMVVYHGTREMIGPFGLDPRMSKTTFPYDGNVLFFAKNSDDAKYFGSDIYECFLDIKKLMSSEQFMPWISEPQREGYFGFEYNSSRVTAIGIFNQEGIMHLPSDVEGGRKAGK